MSFGKSIRRHVYVINCLPTSLSTFNFRLDFILDMGTSQKRMNKSSEFDCFLGVELLFINEESL